MKKYLLLPLLSLLLALVPNVHASAVGDYEGTAVDSSGIIRKHISFHLSITGQVSHFRVNGQTLIGHPFPASSGHFTFDRTDTSPITLRFQGHGRFMGYTRCGGDFREYHHGMRDTNIYYTWAAHHKGKI